jgi:anti-sigma B factor antagonist
MKISEYVIGDVSVVHLKGGIMGGTDFTKFHDRLREYVKVGKRRVVLDLAGVDWIDSRSIGSLVAARTTMINCKGALKLANITERIERLLTISQLMRLFDVYDSVDEAVKSFAE